MPRPTQAKAPTGSGPHQQVTLESNVEQILEESRLLVPGAQTFIGFQLIAVFSNRFAESLDGREQSLHALATALCVIALISYMSPAIYHREVEAGWISAGLINVSTKFLAIGTLLLGTGIAIDFYLICRVIIHEWSLAVAAAAAVVGFIVLFWFGVPRLAPLRALFRR